MAELFFAAEALEAANRADDMWNCLLEAHSVHPLLTLRQRELFSSAAHLKIQPVRVAFREISMISTVPELSPDDFRRASMYRKKLASEVVALADEMATHIKTSILPFQTSGEGKVFFLKLCGDLRRYAAEMEDEGREAQQKQAAMATDCYTQALLAADNLGLEPSHYLRLSTGLNYTVFLYDVMNNDKKAVEVSKQLYDAGVEGLDSLETADMQRAVKVLDAIRGNVSMWSMDPHAKGPAGGKT